ncbi:MAG: glycosyltransferase family 4 protein [Flavobacteriales bacterium]|nr:glycosyltransferase family 4 protein [Flavobacteriales bacterium]MDP4716630.1 glycosyltransferase family 4 protein [Flavobacteriales bacterium]MDP4731457.1 glycosyltransferase family 4 protein [Flavobacteriales bacterium]MDP4818975.1 glycosyltransferase family 4 protein [Flavobacteriales bacterium]
MSHSPRLPKIGFYCSSISWGGLEMNSVRYAQALQQENFEIHIYGVEGNSFFQMATDLGLPIQAVPRNKKYFDFKHARSLAKIFQNDGIEIVHFRDNRDLDFLGWVKFFSSGKIKLVYHQAMQLGVPKKDILHTFRFNRIDAWVSTLDYMKKQVLSHTKFSEKKLHVIPLGTNIDSTSIHSKDEARSLLHLPSNKFLIGVIGRLDEKKGQLEVIQALSLLKETEKNIHVVFIGDKTKNEADEYVQKLNDAIELNHLQDKTSFLPHQSDIQKLYGAFDLVIVPSWEETFGTVTIEAMASGVPVIGSNTAGTAEILGNETFLFQARNPKDLSETLLNVLQDDTLRGNWAVELQHKFQNKYSMKASVAAWKELLLNKL